MKSILWMATAVALLLCVAAAAEQKDKQKTAPQAPAAEPQYVVGAGDVLQVDVWHEPDFSGPAQVRPDGKITVRLLNDVQAAGLTAEQLAADLTERLKKYVEMPRVTVIVN